MRFVSIAVEQCEGTVLAHTQRLGSGLVLKKGRLLGAEDVAALRAAGVRAPTVAVLDPGDRREDDVATVVAEQLADAGCRVAPAATGRVNLHARSPGLSQIDAATIDAVNASCEKVTVATVRPLVRIATGDMIGTVKVIPFAVPQPELTRVLDVARPAIGVTRFNPLRAGLLLTRLPRLQEALLERASEAQRTRLERLGGTLAVEHRCDHGVEPVRAGLEELLVRGCEPVLMLGASAIIDRGDVFPTAIAEAGGTVEHLGMPVDPGNLLLLARRGTTRIVGVPGCARSLKTSGFDWVLERMAAGLEVSSREIVRMGVGGLLKDVPLRPHPRQGNPPERDRRRTSAIILAAGESRRMGERNKLLEAVQGVAMVRRVAETLSASAIDEVVVVTGHDADRVREALAGLNVRFVHNPSFADGMSTSLVTGVSVLADDCDAALIALGDMPWVCAAHVDALVDAFDPELDASICVPVFGKRRGHPVLWASRFFEEMKQVTGDMGARELMQRHRESVREVQVADAGVTLDADTPAALDAVRRYESSKAQ